MHRQMLESPLRVLDLQQADLVYVPLYLQPLAYAHSLWSELDHCNRDATKEASQLVQQFWAEADTLLPRLGEIPHWIGLGTLQREHMGACGKTNLAMPCLRTLKQSWLQQLH